MTVQPWLCPSLIFLLLFCSSSVHSLHFVEQNSLQNASISAETISPTQNLAVSSSPPSPPSSSSSSTRKIVTVIFATAAITFIVVMTFFFFSKYARRWQRNKIDPSFKREAVVTSEEFRKVSGRVKGLIVDENGRDVLYIKDSEDRELNTKFSKVVLNPSYEEEEQESRTDVTEKRTRKYKLQEVKNDREKVMESIQPNQQSLQIASSIQSAVLPSPPSSLPKKVQALPSLLTPPPPPPPPPPLPPSVIVKKHSVPPPPPPRAGGLVSSLRPPSAPRGNIKNQSVAQASTEESTKGNSAGQMKLKPLHWDKVVASTDHSMVWNEIIDGSLRFDDDQIENLFGYTSATSKTLPINELSSSLSNSNPASTAQIFILESRKSQNTAIVLKSLAISRKEILEALLEGHGLTTDVLEKLVRIAPTQEEEAKILQFKGNPSKLANAESFLYHILKAVPSAFFRINAMLFRSNYDAEILQLKESLQTLELACKELRTRGLFLKLLEAILKAGNKMNAGTSRGNAQGFNLTALTKLSDVKSTDGKTTLLHFVVEQVVRSEGRRHSLTRNRNLERNDKMTSNLDSDTLATAAERDKEHILLGLQALGELRIEFSSVRKAANIEYDNFINTCSSLTSRVTEITLLIARCNNGDGGGFVREMKGFLQCCEEELKVVAEEQTRILELVKRTTEYYQAGASKHDRASLLQLFVIVKDFLGMVDQVCIDISQKIEKKNVATSAGSASPTFLPMRTMKFQDFRLHLISDSSRTPSSSESDDDF